MSHISTLEIVIKNLTDARNAAKRLGGELIEGQTSFKWYGREPQSCAHAIRFPGARYEAGLVQQADGTFRLAYDAWSSGGLGRILGGTGERFAQAYGIEAAKRAARLKGYAATEKQMPNGHVQLQLRVA